LFGLVVGTLSGGGVAQLISLAVLVVWLGLGFVSIGVSAGGIDPRFDATDDRRSVGLLGTLASLAGSLGFGLLSVGAFALFDFGLGAVEGTTTHLGPLPTTPAIGALMWVGGVILVAGAVAVVGTLLWFANSRLGRYEGTIAAA
jgi:hypothetical protein